MSCKYSILIPTYNRRFLLEKTIQTITDQNYRDFELIISDSGSDDGTWNFLRNIDNSQVKVYKPKKKLSEVENFEYILDKACGEWIAIIGDDDGVAPNFFFNLDKIINKYPKASAIKANSGYYYHEGTEDLYGKRVVSFNYLSDQISIKNSKLYLFLCLIGFKNRNDVPCMYTSGVIKRKLITKIKEKSNHKFFHSIIEDYYSMVAVLFETKNFIKCEIPLFWIGSSRSSSGRGLAVYENNKNVDEYLKLSAKISEELHKVGISPIYFLECVFKHPYISMFWKSNFIFSLAHISSYILVQNILSFRVKYKISITNVLIIIKNEIKKNNFYKNTFFIILAILNFFFIIDKKIKFLFKIYYFFKKKIFKNFFFTINSADRTKYPGIPECNVQILNILNKK